MILGSEKDFVAGELQQVKSENEMIDMQLKKFTTKLERIKSKKKRTRKLKSKSGQN